jgi:glycerol-3-phosphate dehydrogenase (NAD(P)+)
VKTIAVLGAGSWGTALSVHLGRIGHDVRLWARDVALVQDMNVRRANAVYLPDVTMPPNVAVTHDMAAALSDAHIVVTACRPRLPGCRFDRRRRTCARHRRRQRHQGPVNRCSGCRGRFAGSRPHTRSSCVGPELRDEVAQQLPTAVLAASTTAVEIVQAGSGPTFGCMAAKTSSASRSAAR